MLNRMVGDGTHSKIFKYGPTTASALKAFNMAQKM